MKYTKYVFTYRRGIIIGIILTAGLFLGILAVRQSQEMRRKAAVPGGSAYLTLSPGSTTLPPNTSQEILFTSSIQQNMIDGIQIVANITGDIPPDMQFIPSVPSEFRLITNTLESSGSGKILRLVFLTNQPQTPYANTNPIQIGKLTFTSPDSGTLSIAFDQTLSKIMQNQEAQDVLQIPSDAVYTFLLPTPSTSPPPAGPFGQAVSLNGSSYIHVDHEGTISPKLGFTIEAWIKPSFAEFGTSNIMFDENTDPAQIIPPFELSVESIHDAGSGDYIMKYLFYTNDNSNGCDHPTRTAQLSIHYTSSESSKVTSWHHVAGIIEQDGNVRIAVDGLMTDRNETTSGFCYQGKNLFVGARKLPGFTMDNYFQGQIDEVRISTGARYSNHFFHPIAPFVPDGETSALYHFDGTLDDASGNGHNGIPNGTITYEASTLPIPTPTATLIPIPPPGNSAPVFTTANTLPNATVNEAYKTEIAAEDPDLTDQLTMWLPDPPTGLSLTNCQTEQIENMNTIRCYLSGTPTQAGGYSPAMYVSDNVGHEVLNNQFSLQVVPKEKP